MFDDNGIIKTIGKEIDIINIKSDLIKGYSIEIDEIKSIINEALMNNDFEKLQFCPVCNTEASSRNLEITIYDLNYLRCNSCNHLFTELVLSDSAMENYFITNDNLSSIYTNKELTKKRIDEIYKPKLEYVVKTFNKIYGRNPRSILDVGAGGGHFVYIARQNDIRCEGIELNSQSIEFCKNNFVMDIRFHSH